MNVMRIERIVWYLCVEIAIAFFPWVSSFKVKLFVLGAFQNHKALFVYVHKPQSFHLCHHKHLCGDIICATWLAPNCH